MTDDTLLTRADLERLWNVGKCAAAARVRKYARDIRKIKIGPCDAFAITFAEAKRLEAECKARWNEARRTNGKKRSTEFLAANPGYVSRRDRTPKRPERPIKVATPKPATAPTTNRKRAKKPAGWHKTMCHLLTPRQPEPALPALPPCEPTVAGVIARYHVSKRVVRGWILDGLMRVDADGRVDAESMARVKRCYQERRPSRWMEKTLAEFGSL